MILLTTSFIFFFFNDTATTEIYTLSLHDALPISKVRAHLAAAASRGTKIDQFSTEKFADGIAYQQNAQRSEEHTSELQSQSNLVCRLLLEKKKKKKQKIE